MAKGHAEIAGAGVAGLIAAAALAQRGWTVRVHERAPDLRNYGAGISCWYNFAKCLKAVGAYEQARQNARPFYIRETRDEKNRVLYTIAAEPDRGIQTFSLTRRDLSFALASAAQQHGVEIVTSSRGVSADPSGELVTEEGRRYRADLVIAADGVNSSIRDGLGLLKKRVKLGEGAVRMLIPRTDEERQSEDGRKGIEYWSGARRLYYTANNTNEVYLAFMVPASDVEGNAVPIRKDVWIKSFPYLKGLIERVGDQGRWDEFEQITLHKWSSGKVAVVGDAGSAMAPNIGQGGGYAAVNALALAVCVSEARSLEEGLATWEEKQRPITEYTQRVSYWYGRMNDLPPFLRAQFIKLVGRSKFLVNIRQRPANIEPLGYVAEA